MFSHLNKVQMTRRYRKDHDLMGYEADDLLSSFDTVSEADIWQYRYPDDKSLSEVGIRGIYLGNYCRWDPLEQHRQMKRLAGYRGAKQQRTFDIYDDVDDFQYMGLHDWIKEMKHGYGKVTDQLVREIRHKRISRSQAIVIEKEYRSKWPSDIRLFSEWIVIPSHSLMFMLSQHFGDADQTELQSMNSPENCRIGDSYITIRKAYPDHDNGVEEHLLLSSA